MDEMDDATSDAYLSNSMESLKSVGEGVWEEQEEHR